mgnify:CR=1 FL=1
MLVVEEGRPKDEGKRLDKEIRVYDLLEKLEIQYWRADHQPLETMEACREVDKALDVNICKSLFLCNAQKTSFYLLLMPGDKKFKTKDLSKQIGSARLSFADSESMEKYLDLTPGSVSVMGLMNDKSHKVQLLIDDELLQDEYMACHPCINTSSIKLKTQDLLKVFLPELGHKPIIVSL